MGAAWRGPNLREVLAPVKRRAREIARPPDDKGNQASSSASMAFCRASLSTAVSVTLASPRM